MKKFALVSLLLFSNAHAIQLNDYAEVVDAVHNGMSIKYVVDWDLCKISIPDVKPDFSSSYSPDNVIISKKGILASRGMTYSHEISQAPFLGPVNQSYVYMLTSANELKVVNRFLDPVTYAEKMPAVHAKCQLGEAVKIFAQ